MLGKIGLGSLLIGMLAFSSSTQIVKIPDPNFKQALIQKKVDANGDVEIQVAEARKITKVYLEDVPFSSLEGIKSFTSLVELGTYKNKIRYMDLEGMTSLQSVYLA